VTPRVLFLHGLTVDNRDAIALARALPATRVVAPNLPAHGGEPPAPDWHPRALAAALDVAHPERAFIVGHSWGAAISAFLAAARARDRTAGLVLLEGGWFDRAELPRREPPRDPHHREALDALFAARASETWQQIAALGIPVLAIAGLRDDVDGAKARALERFRSAAPHAETEAWADVGHDLLRDAPERTCARIASFVAARSKRD
jgi:pimeloyl-ACP methyl ester carboxylesterase